MSKNLAHNEDQVNVDDRPLARRAQALLETTIDELLTAPSEAVVPVDIRETLDAVIDDTKHLSYRDAAVVQLAFRSANNAPLDITIRQPGGRGVSGWLGKHLAKKHIRAVRDAFQNVGKNSENLVRGNHAAFDKLMVWSASLERTPTEINNIFRYTCSKIAENARPIKPFPSLNLGELTFSKVAATFSKLYDTPSAGAYEQFSIAALLHALIEQQGEPSYRVETKNLNASDRSSRAAGDIQILVGNRIVEAIEVTANDWREKIAGAAKTIRDYDLSRLTILANGVNSSGDALFDDLSKINLDIAVHEIRSFAFSIIGALTKQGRASAFTRLYELLDRYQADVSKVNMYVDLLFSQQITEHQDA